MKIGPSGSRAHNFENLAVRVRELGTDTVRVPTRASAGYTGFTDSQLRLITNVNY